MCLERLVQLKCDHYESTQFDKCKTSLGRLCAQYVQVIVRREAGRSCTDCKAKQTALLGFALVPSLKRFW